MSIHPSPSDLKTDGNYRGSVLISGASSGIGLCCAIMLAEKGFQVWAGYRKEADGERLRFLHQYIIPISLDVTCEQSVQNALHLVMRATDGRGLDGLVNNAGIVVGGPLEFLPIEALRRQWEVNVIGQVTLTQAFIPLLRQARGRIINMGSVAGLNALPFIGPYSASKYALEALTDSLRVELRPWGIQVAIIEPGVVATPIWEKSLQAAVSLESALPSGLMELYGKVLEILKAEIQKTAQRGFPPEHVAEAVLHALSSPNPRTRYQVGRDAKLRLLFRCLPDRLKDWLIIRKVGLPG